MELADIVNSLRLHWRVSVAIVLLTIGGLAAFLTTRKTIRPRARYRVSVDVLVPAIDSKGNRPEGVPPSLLQGQSRLALSTATESDALRAAKIPAQGRAGIQFFFSGTGDTLSLGASASDPDTALVAAAGVRESVRERVVGASWRAARPAEQRPRRTRSASLYTRRTTVDRQLKAADANLYKLVVQQPVTATSANGTSSNTSNSRNSTPTLQLPASLPLDTVLLAVERQQLQSTIASLQLEYAQDEISTIIPNGYATTVEVGSPIRTTAPPPSSSTPSALFFGIGLFVALAAPIVMDRLDHSIRNAKTASAAFDSIVLTSVPAASHRVLYSIADPGTPLDSAYRALAATSIATDRLPEAIVVTSPTGDIQDAVAANFAAALAGLGLKVALIATDARQAWFVNGGETGASAGNGTEDSGGAPTLSFPDLVEMAHRGTLNGALPRGLVQSHLEKLLVMPPGDADREIRLDGLRPLLEALSTSGVDVAVIAGPSVLEDPNATILAWTTRSVLWAFETGDVTEDEAKSAAARGRARGATSFGIAMVNGKN